MKLHEIPKGSRIKIETINYSGKLGDFLIFDHIDGKYSYCTVEGQEHEIVRLRASTELTLSGDYYERLH